MHNKMTDIEIIQKDDRAVSDAIKLEDPEQKVQDPVKNGIRLSVLAGLLVTIIAVVLAAINPSTILYQSVFGLGLGTTFLFLVDRNYYKIFAN